MRWECRERFPRHRLPWKPLVNDLGMHHGTCVMHVPLCMSGSLTRSGGEKVPGIPGACATRNFTYLARGPWTTCYYTPRTTKLLGGILVSLRPSVRPSVRLSVRLSRLPCPLRNIYSSGWILSILATNDHYHKRVCRAQWPLTLTYIFKVIRPWLRKSCPLCSVYKSRWILFIFGTNYHYH